MAISAPKPPSRPMVGGTWPAHVWVKNSGRYIADTYGIWYLIPDYIPDGWVNRLRLEVEKYNGRVHWHWTGWNNGEGHGKFKQGGKTKYVHRDVVERVDGVKLTRWQYVDHKVEVCGRKSCMVRDHLEPVPPGVNTARGPGAATQYRPPADYGEPLDAIG